MMKRIISLLTIIPTIVFAQKPVPRLDGDTLYTSSGFKMFIGQTLHLTQGSGKRGKFVYVVNARDGNMPLTHTTVVIEKFKSFKISALGNGFVWAKVSATLKDGSKSGSTLRIAFDLAIHPLNGLPPEFDVPVEFRSYQRKQGTVGDEIKKLKDLLDAGALTQEEFEEQKKKLLEKQ